MMRNPIFESSMTRRMRSYRAPLLLTLYVVFLLLVSGVALVTLQKAQLSLGNLRAGIETYIYLSVMQFALIILVAPALTAGSIAGERERQTLDLLLCTRVSSLSIVLGKLLSSVCFLGLMVVASLPPLVLTLFFGGITLSELLLMMVFLIVTALACCSIGIFCSAVFKRTVTATVVAYLSIFALGVGTILFPIVFQMGQINELLDMVRMAQYGTSSVFIGGSGQVATEAVRAIPKILYLNPGVGLFSMLVQQTGILQRTFEMGGYQGNQLYSLFELSGSTAMINMAVLVGTSMILTGLAAVFIKPSGRRSKKKS